MQLSSDTNAWTPLGAPFNIDATGAARVSSRGALQFGGTPTASIPTFSPGAGSYSTSQSVSISTTSGTVICYNTTGAPATNGTAGCTTGTLYSGPVTVSSTQTLYAVAGGTGFLDSSVGSASYTITTSTPSAPAPAIFALSPNGFKPLECTMPCTVTFTCAYCTAGTKAFGFVTVK